VGVRAARSLVSSYVDFTAGERDLLLAGLFELCVARFEDSDLSRGLAGGECSALLPSPDNPECPS
jgi:hypothetical protein